MQVERIMKRQLIVGHPADSLSAALETMLWAGIRHLPIVERGRLVGVLSERDILAHRGRISKSDGVPIVSDAMTSPAQFVEPDEDIAIVAKRMAEDRLGCMPVLRRGSLVGIVTAVDMLAHEGSRAFESPA